MSMIPALMGGRSLSHPLPLAVGKSSSKMYVGGQASAIVAQVALDGSVAEDAHTMLDKYTIPANTLVAGSTIRVRVVGRVTTVASTPTLQAFISLGASSTTPLSNNQLLSTTDATTAATDFWVIEGTIQFRTVGATATGYAMFSYCDPADQATKRAIATTISGTAAVDTTAALYLSADLQWSADNDANDATLEMFIVDIVNPGV
jgi:hypothetical protein